MKVLRNAEQGQTANSILLNVTYSIAVNYQILPKKITKPSLYTEPLINPPPVRTQCTVILFPLHPIHPTVSLLFHHALSQESLAAQTHRFARAWMHTHITRSRCSLTFGTRTRLEYIWWGGATCVNVWVTKTLQRAFELCLRFIQRLPARGGSLWGEQSVLMSRCFCCCCWYIVWFHSLRVAVYLTTNLKHLSLNYATMK